MKTLTILLTAIILLGITHDCFPQSVPPISLWSSQVDGRNAVNGSSTDNFQDFALDNNGNCYVIGNSVNGATYNADILVSKVSSQGVIQWVRAMSDTANWSHDVAVSIEVDNAGNCYAVWNKRWGKIGVSKFSSDGVELWNYTSPSVYDLATGSVINSNGDLYIGGSTRMIDNQTQYGFLLIKLSSGGGEAFYFKHIAVDIGNNQNNCDPGEIILDNNQDPIIVGYYRRHVGVYESMVAVKYSGANPAWTFYDEGDSSYSGGSDTRSKAIVLPDNSIYMVGQFSTAPNNSLHLLTFKIGANGSLQWKKLNTTNDKLTIVRGIDIDQNNNLHIISHQKFNSPLFCGLYSKYDPSGNIVIQKNLYKLGYTTVLLDMDIHVKNNNEIYIAGMTILPNVNKNSLTLLNSNGDSVWCKGINTGQNYVGGSSTDIYSIKLTEGPGGDLFYGGTTTTSQPFVTYNDMLITRTTYSNNASATYISYKTGIPINDNQTARDSIIVDFDNSDYILTDVNVVIDSINHTSTGDLIITLEHNGVTDTLINRAGGGGDHFINTRLDDGAASPVGGGTAPFTGNYKPQSPLSVFNNLDPTGSWTLRVYDAAMGNTGTLDGWALELTFENPTNISSISNELPDRLSLHQNYPNPFNPVTKIRFDIPVQANGSTKLAIYDITGREVALLVNQHLSPGSYEYSFDGGQLSSGVYFYKLQLEDYTETKRMVLLK